MIHMKLFRGFCLGMGAGSGRCGPESAGSGFLASSTYDILYIKFSATMVYQKADEKADETFELLYHWASAINLR